MKKIIALIMVLAMMLSCTAFAEPTKLADFGDENTMVYDRTVAFEDAEDEKDDLGNPTNGKVKPVGNSHVISWAGDWVLVAAYVSEAAIDEFEYEVEPGYYAVPENAIIMNLNPLYDASNTDPAGSGPIVDQGNYYHCHTYDLEGTLTFAEQFGEEVPYTLSNIWDTWAYTVEGEHLGTFNFGPCQTSFKKGSDTDTLRWNDVTGFDFEDMDDLKYLGINPNGQMIICSASKKINTNLRAEIYLAYVFERVVPEEVAE